jgi:acyl carrier protein
MSQPLDPPQLMELMRAYFAGSQPEAVLSSLETRYPEDLLKESLDVVEFAVYLEEELGTDLDINGLGQALAGKTFGELAAEVPRFLAERR